MKQSKESIEMGFIRARALEDLANTSDEELRDELMKDGEDILSVSAEVRAKLGDVVALSMRNKLAMAKVTARKSALTTAPPQHRPPIERLKALIAEAFQREPKVALAFRDGKRQSEEDLGSVYDDLIRMGVIKSEKDAD